jgi:hypothetical protein
MYCNFVKFDWVARLCFFIQVKPKIVGGESTFIYLFTYFYSPNYHIYNLLADCLKTTTKIRSAFIQVIKPGINTKIMVPQIQQKTRYCC